MKRVGAKTFISPRDLIAELECDHRLHLEWAVLESLVVAPSNQLNPELDLLVKHGTAHEQRLVEGLSKDLSLRKIPNTFDEGSTVQDAFEKTMAAMVDGVDVIYSPTLVSDDFIGYPDFLVKARDEFGEPLKDESGRIVYDPVDAKSARSEKRAAVLQVAAYALALVRIGLPHPDKVHLWLAGDRTWSTPAKDVVDLAELFYNRAIKRIEGFNGQPVPDWAAPRESCSRCRWTEHCEIGRRKSDDLSLIQGIRSTTRLALIDAGITSVREMAQASDEIRRSGKKEISKETFDNLRAQAQIQLKGANIPVPIFEVKDESGFSLIPASSEGDIWFDMEGDPYAEEGDGLEYMFGLVFKEGTQFKFRTFDAENRTEERRAFEEFVKFLINRRNIYPDMHVYHYASYEPSALLRLAQHHGHLESEVDRLVREGVFIDLYSVVRKIFRFSTESLSIKTIEPIFYKGNRDKPVATSIGSVVAFEDALEKLRRGNREDYERAVQEIRDYNEDDCRSTQDLDHWIRDQAASRGIDLGRSALLSADIRSEDSQELQEPITAQLLVDVPIRKKDRTEEQNGKALVAAAIEYHRREERPAWWSLFDKALSDLSEMQGASDVVLPDQITTTGWSSEGRKLPRRHLKFHAPEGLDLRHILDFEHIPQALYDVAPIGFKSISGSNRGFRDVQILELESDFVLVEEKANKTGTWEELPMALLPGAPIPTHTIRRVLRDEIGQTVLLAEEQGIETFPKKAHMDVLLRRIPRQKSGRLPRLGDDVASVTQALIESDDSYVAVQGPPGTGKTFIGAHVIVNLVRHGWRIGVVAQSHAVIENLLKSVQKIDPSIPIAKKGQSAKSLPDYHVEEVSSWAWTQSAGFVIGGTTWSYASAGMRNLPLDLMVVDEAGQYSLANSLVPLSCAKRALLLGDPQQLPHVSQGKHPEPVDKSVLRHILGENKTMPDNLGYFLSKTYRLHPLLAQPVSRLQYEDRLISDDRCNKRELKGVEPGLHVMEVQHTGNTTKSIEEAEEVVTKVSELLGSLWTDVDKNGAPANTRQLDESDVLVIAAYNNQVRLLKQKLAAAGYSKIKVGTIDKFQGQEGVIVIISMATSSSEDLPRGIEFLLSPNRLNVAISRAQWACFLLASPSLRVMEPSTADGMVMLGKFVTLCKKVSADHRRRSW